MACSLLCNVKRLNLFSSQRIIAAFTTFSNAKNINYNCCHCSSQSGHKVPSSMAKCRSKLITWSRYTSERKSFAFGNMHCHQHCFPTAHFSTSCASSRRIAGNDKASDLSSTSTTKAGKNVASLLESWFYEVSPYGSIEINLPFTTVVKPLNPQEYPDMNKCLLELHYNIPEGEGSSLPNSHELSQISDTYKLSVAFDKDKAHMTVNADMISGLKAPIACYLNVPLMYDVSVRVRGNKNVSVESMESNTIRVEADAGHVLLRKNKSGSVAAFTKSGDIVCQSTLLGNADLHCGEYGSISAQKLQGSSISCSTALGSVSVRSLYADKSTFKTVTGDVALGHCHGKICVAGEKSDVIIESLDGDLDVGVLQGSVGVHLSRHKKVDIDMNAGDINISFTEGVNTNLNLSCPSVVLGENLNATFDKSENFVKEGCVGERGEAEVNARTLSGNISLQVLDWIQTTKLAFQK